MRGITGGRSFIWLALSCLLTTVETHGVSHITCLRSQFVANEHMVVKLRFNMKLY